MQRVAFFDIDGTVFRSSLLIEIVNALIADEVFPTEAKEEIREVYEAWQNREGAYDDYIAAVIVVYLKYIKGVYYGDLADIGSATSTRLSLQQRLD
jgi:predicted nucleic-acid-binding protein